MQFYAVWLLAVCGVAVAKVPIACDYRDDVYSPFYWAGQENICNQTLCDMYPDLQCGLSRSYIEDQAMNHWPEDVMTEIGYLQKYFNTMIPITANSQKYECHGLCSGPMKPLTRIFTDLTDGSGPGKRRYMCHVIGPNIFYKECQGKCKTIFGVMHDHVCVPDVTVSVQVWVYCEGVYPGCRKVRVNVPLSCTCKKVMCHKELPPIKYGDIVLPWNIPV